MDERQALLLALVAEEPAPPPPRPAPTRLHLEPESPIRHDVAELRQALGPPPKFRTEKGSTEVVCHQCLAQALPKRKLAGSSILTLLLGGFGMLIAGALLVMMSRSSLQFDNISWTWVEETPLEIGLGTWAFGLALSLVPAFGYHRWRIARGHWVCLACGNSRIVESHSPEGRALIARRTATTAG